MVPDALAAKVKLMPRLDAARVWLSARLPVGAALPHFFGGTTAHELPRTADGDLDVAELMRSLAED